MDQQNKFPPPATSFSSTFKCTPLPGCSLAGHQRPREAPESCPQSYTYVRQHGTRKRPIMRVPFSSDTHETETAVNSTTTLACRCTNEITIEHRRCWKGIRCARGTAGNGYRCRSSGRCGQIFGVFIHTHWASLSFGSASKLEACCATNSGVIAAEAGGTSDESSLSAIFAEHSARGTKKLRCKQYRGAGCACGRINKSMYNFRRFVVPLHPKIRGVSVPGTGPCREQGY